MIRKKRITILHDLYNKKMFISKILNNRFIFKQDQEIFDNYIQSKLVKKHLIELGYRVKLKPFSQSLKLNKTDLVFNIVETIESEGTLIYKAPEFLENNKIPFTGGNSKVMLLTTDKILTKELLIANSIQTPAWVTKSYHNGFIQNRHYIFKPRNEDASVGISSESVFFIENIQDLLTKLDEFELRDNKDYFAEEYIDGREFNISIINFKGEPLVLPPAELIFKNFNKDKFKVACYNSKWSEGSFEYENTQRTFKTNSEDKLLIDNIKKVALQCWDVFNLKGYARVDLRIDSSNNIKVLEINSNPCISQDSGFVAAALEYGLTYSNILQNIIDDLNS